MREKARDFAPESSHPPFDKIARLQICVKTCRLEHYSRWLRYVFWIRRRCKIMHFVFNALDFFPFPKGWRVRIVATVIITVCGAYESNMNVVLGSSICLTLMHLPSCYPRRENLVVSCPLELAVIGYAGWVQYDFISLVSPRIWRYGFDFPINPPVILDLGILELLFGWIAQCGRWKKKYASVQGEECAPRSTLPERKCCVYNVKSLFCFISTFYMWNIYIFTYLSCA